MYFMHLFYSFMVWVTTKSCFCFQNVFIFSIFTFNIRVIGILYRECYEPLNAVLRVIFVSLNSSLALEDNHF